MKNTKFYICNHCGNVITKIHDSGVPVVCCGEKMTELVPGTVEASLEKHIPEVSVRCGKVKATVGSIIHPMSEEHSILWIYLETDRGGYIKHLAPTDAPEAEFSVKGEKPLAVYAYCNLHGLWKKEI